MSTAGFRVWCSDLVLQWGSSHTEHIAAGGFVTLAGFEKGKETYLTQAWYGTQSLRAPGLCMT